MTERHRISFGIKTVPAHTTYPDILRVWQEADDIPEIEHAWLWDHFLPLFGDVGGPIFEGWTLLAALAARTERIRLGLMVTNNRARPPAVLGKMAATVDVISNGRLDLGVGVGGTRKADRPRQELAEREYHAYGIPLVSPARGISELADTCALVRRMWTEEVFDFDGRSLKLTGVRCAPKPVQRPGPPILIGGWGDQTLRVVAEHADLWNVPGPPHMDLDTIRDRCAALDAACAAVGRDPNEIIRSVQYIAPVDDYPTARKTVRDLIDIGMTHIVLNIGAVSGLARDITDEIINPVRDEF